MGRMFFPGRAIVASVRKILRICCHLNYLYIDSKLLYLNFEGIKKKKEESMHSTTILFKI